jgi:hypothetical protein
MPPSNPNRFTTWYLIIKDEWLPGQKERLAAWFQAARQEPRLVWQTPQIRYGAIGVGAFAGLMILFSFLGSFSSNSNVSRERARTADFMVICSDARCGYTFVINKKFSFDDFPVPCPKCHRESGMRAVRCWSKSCGGKHVAAREEEGQLVCPKCNAVLDAG